VAGCALTVGAGCVLLCVGLGLLSIECDMQAYLTCLVVGVDFHDRGLVRGLVGVCSWNGRSLSALLCYGFQHSSRMGFAMRLSYADKLCLCWTGFLVVAAPSRVCGTGIAGALELKATTCVKRGRCCCCSPQFRPAADTWGQKGVSWRIDTL